MGSSAVTCKYKPSRSIPCCMGCFGGIFNKNKVIFIMGATGTGKSRLSIDLATQIPAEIINSDKIQVYKGLDIVTNKVTEKEREGVPHHLLGEVEPDSDFTTRDFCYEALSAIDRILDSGRFPIIVGGSNSFLEALVEDPLYKFKSRFACCFIWIDVSPPVLFSYVSKRVDQMVDAGLVEEVGEIFDPEADYGRGIRRAIGVPEMDEYFRAEAKMDETSKETLLASAIEEIKSNTCKLACRQVEKIQRLKNELRWPISRIDATVVFEKTSGEEADNAWNMCVLDPCMEILSPFLNA
nr:adenylate isopentenyltransferase 5, chloroplastic-like isoform X1 [Coffea arabica]XP_027109640.1 adenylate isopentenyltransferase 5, chloroplastic-like isoform X1 [Coffea arabica]